MWQNLEMRSLLHAASCFIQIAFCNDFSNYVCYVCCMRLQHSQVHLSSDFAVKIGQKFIRYLSVHSRRKNRFCCYVLCAAAAAAAVTHYCCRRVSKRMALRYYLYPNAYLLWSFTQHRNSTSHFWNGKKKKPKWNIHFHSSRWWLLLVLKVN